MLKIVKKNLKILSKYKKTYDVNISKFIKFIRNITKNEG